MIEMTRRPITQPIRTIVQIPSKGNNPMTSLVFEEVADRPTISRNREIAPNPFLSTLERMAATDETLRFTVPFSTEAEAKELRSTLRLLAEAGTAVDRTVRKEVVLKSGRTYAETVEGTNVYADPSKGDTASVTFWTVPKIRQTRKTA